jgi:protein SCO1
MSGFGPNFIGLTGEPVAIRKAAKTFKVFFQKKSLPDSDYTMDHSAVIYILDPQTRVRLMFTVAADDIGALSDPADASTPT